MAWQFNLKSNSTIIGEALIVETAVMAEDHALAWIMHRRLPVVLYCIGWVTDCLVFYQNLFFQVFVPVVES